MKQYEHLAPYSEGLTIKDFIKRMNISRTFLRAQSNYFTQVKEAIDSHIHYFAASESRGIIESDGWLDLSKKTVTFYEIIGDHGSIFEDPGIIEFAKIFASVMSKVENKQ
jgi:hypothetical protein